MLSPLAGIDIEGPVQAEVFVLALGGDGLTLTGPCGAAPWLIEVGASDHPLDVVTRVAREALGDFRLVHSTSWRRDRDAVVLTFLVVAEAALLDRFAGVPVERADLARSTATAAPSAIGQAQVIEHALRHLAWLAREDPVVGVELSAAWHEALAPYTPEPFRTLA
jgi:hypothetical protein